ncbi:squalene synthase HpnC [Orrella daihaiensis]|uniref:Squalene synthase HpnC n=1 Tax=Orrella daihaiensis TaxID=2782176 RepID=A0ABY4AGL9_9BURK|nr:squalene synthase HpnC [Orrella daihaiensis]UOD49439.1 squalene synthase HpnC [Orrella daihaiensis]
MSVNHYENFPVASLLLPSSLREDVVHIYRFARAADDIADEGDATASERKSELAKFRHALVLISEQPHTQTVGDPILDDIFLPLAKTIQKHRLPLKPLTDLLSAFEQDTQVQHYRDEDHLMDYCKRSANPVGRLMLHLFKQVDPESLNQSDAICTALQRINFLQDVAIDIRKQRIYLPADALSDAGVTVEHLMQGRCDHAWKTLMRQQISICRDLMQKGAPLGRKLKGRIALEIRLIIAGGLRILDKIEAVDCDVFNHRPTLNKFDWIRMLARAL